MIVTVYHSNISFITNDKGIVRCTMYVYILLAKTITIVWKSIEGNRIAFNVWILYFHSINQIGNVIIYPDALIQFRRISSTFFIIRYCFVVFFLLLFWLTCYHFYFYFLSSLDAQCDFPSTNGFSNQTLCAFTVVLELISRKQKCWLFHSSVNILIQCVRSHLCTVNCRNVVIIRNMAS